MEQDFEVIELPHKATGAGYKLLPDFIIKIKGVPVSDVGTFLVFSDYMRSAIRMAA